MEYISLKIYTTLKTKGKEKAVKSVWGLAEYNTCGNERQPQETCFSYLLSFFFLSIFLGF
jgi:hypothetical protein